MLSGKIANPAAEAAAASDPFEVEEADEHVPADATAKIKPVKEKGAEGKGDSASEECRPDGAADASQAAGEGITEGAGASEEVEAVDASAGDSDEGRGGAEVAEGKNDETADDEGDAAGSLTRKGGTGALTERGTDLSGLDERVVEPSYMPPVASWRTGDTLKMPAVPDAPAPQQKEFRAPDAPGKKKGHRGAKIAAAVLVLLALAGGAAALVTYQMELWGGKAVPDVAGMTQADATSVLEGKGFSVRATQVKSDETEGVVLLMDPGAGSRRDEGAEIVIHVAVSRTIPDVMGKPKDEAAAILDESGFDEVSYVEEKSDEAEGSVLAIDPAVGEKARAATPITVTVAVPYTVPDVAGLTYDEAQAAVEAEGFAPFASYVYTENVAAGTVLGTDPVAGAKLASGSQVGIQVAKSRATELVEATYGIFASGNSVRIDGIDYLVSSCDSVSYEGSETVAYTITAQPYTYFLGVMLPLEARQVSGTIVWGANNTIAGGTPLLETK